MFWPLIQILDKLWYKRQEIDYSTSFCGIFLMFEWSSFTPLCENKVVPRRIEGRKKSILKGDNSIRVMACVHNIDRLFVELKGYFLINLQNSIKCHHFHSSSSQLPKWLNIASFLGTINHNG